MLIAFEADKRRWVTLVLEDGRRIMGHPRRFPVDAIDGHVSLQLARWVLDSNETIELTGRAHHKFEGLTET